MFPKFLWRGPRGFGATNAIVSERVKTVWEPEHCPRCLAKAVSENLTLFAQTYLRFVDV